MTTNERKINRDLIVGWTVIVIVLFISYMLEVFKGERPPAYVTVFTLVTVLPAVACGLHYRKNPINRNLRYQIVAGYFIMYVFVMFSGSTTLVFTYILPLLSLLILYHQPKLILGTGIAAMLVNIALIAERIYNHQVTVSNSKDVEIQAAVLLLCFGGSYVGARLYDEINYKNEKYVAELDEKSKQIQRMTLQTIETIANTIDAKDEYTKGHSRRVSEYAVRIATELHMSEDEILNIRYIALLHDIGKIGVPDSVLNKPGRLTDAEFDLMRKHAAIGGEILKDDAMLPDLAVGAKCHHERYDGKGYPMGLAGEEIPKTARIICLADAYDAMTTNRVYRKHLSKEAVLEELKRCRGTQFDPEITDVFLNYLEHAPEWVIGEEAEEQQTLGEASNKLLQRIVSDHVQRGAELDELTGVLKRSAGEKKIASSMEENKGCLILVNVDNMRKINRKYGFRQGDSYLKMVADMLNEMALDIIVSRFSGDEFLCYVPNVTETGQIEEMVDDLMKEIAHFVEQEGQAVKFSVSAGIAVQDSAGGVLHSLLMRADKALYHVKQEQKNGYYFYRQVADRNDDVEKVDWNHVLETTNVMPHAAGADKQNGCLVMITAKTADENRMNIEEREEVMRMIEIAISNTLKGECAVAKYSSIQRIVMITGEKEENISQVTEAIFTNFYKMYDKKNVELYYDIANLNSTGVKEE